MAASRATVVAGDRPQVTVSSWRMATLALLFIVAFFAPMRELYRDWTLDPNYSHGFLIPVVSAYLIWRERRNLVPAPDRRGSLLGWTAIAAATVLAVAGAAAAEWFTLRVSMLLFFQGMVLTVGGWAFYRQLWFPLNFLFFMVPIPYVIYYRLTFPLQLLSTRLTHEFLSLIGVASLREGNILHFPDFSLEVIEACSGLRSIMVLLALGALLAMETKMRVSGKWLLFLLAVPIAILANCARLLFSAFLGLWGRPDLVETVLVHQGSGIAVFLAGLGVYMLVQQILRRWFPIAKPS